MIARERWRMKALGNKNDIGKLNADFQHEGRRT